MEQHFQFCLIVLKNSLWNQSGTLFLPPAFKAGLSEQPVAPGAFQRMGECFVAWFHQLKKGVHACSSPLHVGRSPWWRQQLAHAPLLLHTETHPFL